ncbi:MAG: hypothetical protein EON89_14895 [Brevundimonas sp.]|nr:MAG: hypothetical protein EON89_14895 [Brevundimonas sp.]
MDRARAALIWRAAFAATGWIGLALQYGLLVAPAHPTGQLAVWTLNYFSYFTILTNLLVALVLTLPVVAPSSRVGRWALNPSVRARATLYLSIVGLGYHLLLSAGSTLQGLAAVGNFIVHYIMPVAALLDWLVFTPRGGLRWSEPFGWLRYPLIYFVWTALHGYAAGWWPYWFLNLPQLGLARSALVVAVLLIVLLVAGFGFVAIDRTLARRDRTPAPA